MSNEVALLARLYFSYSQFMVYDESVQLPGCAWTEKHSAQGFARRPSTLNFGTPLEFGYASVTVSFGAYDGRGDYQRVVAVPFLVTSGRVVVEGPEGTEPGRSFALPPAYYRLVAAQRVTGEEEEAVDLFFERLTKPLERSAVLLADDALHPPTPLLEDAESA